MFVPVVQSAFVGARLDYRLNDQAHNSYAYNAQQYLDVAAWLVGQGAVITCSTIKLEDRFGQYFHHVSPNVAFSVPTHS